jgi:hypothetical protein
VRLLLEFGWPPKQPSQPDDLDTGRLDAAAA